MSGDQKEGHSELLTKKGKRKKKNELKFAVATHQFFRIIYFQIWSITIIVLFVHFLFGPNYCFTNTIMELTENLSSIEAKPSYDQSKILIPDYIYQFKNVRRFNCGKARQHFNRLRSKSRYNRNLICSFMSVKI